MPGTMRKRGNDSWYLEVTIGTDFRGKPNRYSRTVHGTKKQAEKELAKFYADCEAGKVNKSNTATVGDICRMYIEKMPDLSPETVKGYEVVMKNYLCPIENRKASKLTTLHVQEWVNFLSKEYESKRAKKKGLSPKSVRNAFQFLNAAMNMAGKWGIIENNACKNVLLPDLERKEVNYLNSDETMSLIRCLNGVPKADYNYKVAVLYSLFASLRKGEIFGLEEQDVDFEHGYVAISRARYAKTGGGTYVKSVKSKTSNREVAIPMQLVEETKRLVLINRERQLALGSQWRNSSALFKGTFGDPMYPNMLYVWLDKFLKENGIRHIGIHGLRHTHASMLLHLNTNIGDISRQLGHASKSVTERYLHNFKAPERQIADSMESAFLNANQK